MSSLSCTSRSMATRSNRTAQQPAVARPFGEGPQHHSDGEADEPEHRGDAQDRRSAAPREPTAPPAPGSRRRRPAPPAPALHRLGGSRYCARYIGTEATRSATIGLPNASQMTTRNTALSRDRPNPPRMRARLTPMGPTRRQGHRAMSAGQIIALSRAVSVREGAAGAKHRTVGAPGVNRMAGDAGGAAWFRLGL